jgi:hypothetical protein
MPVFINPLIPSNAPLPGYAIAKVLANEAIRHFNAVRPAHAGIGPASCCAAFAVNPTFNFPAVAGHRFGVAFGNSRVAAGGLDQGPVGGHAERCAITAAGNNGLDPMIPHAVLFVELAPCPSCATWLVGGGGGVPNPYDFGSTGINLDVWYAFSYPDGVPAMVAFHNMSLDEQLATAATW